MNKFLMLDIDGVLNNHMKLENGYCTIDIDKVYLLNEIVAKTDCEIILISAWRYLIISGSMTLTGFRNMLATYGASSQTCNALSGFLPRDVNVNDPHDRGKLARKYLDARQVSVAVVVDDLALGYSEHNISFVQTVGSIGLTKKNTNKIIRILNRIDSHSSI